jgi:hypothetical protein
MASGVEALGVVQRACMHPVWDRKARRSVNVRTVVAGAWPPSATRVANGMTSHGARRGSSGLAGKHPWRKVALA